MAFSMAAGIERYLILQRTKEALRFRKAQGMKLGQPRGTGKSKLDPFQPEIEGPITNGATQKFIAKRYNITEVNLRNWIKKRSACKAHFREIRCETFRPFVGFYPCIPKLRNSWTPF